MSELPLRAGRKRRVGAGTERNIGPRIIGIARKIEPVRCSRENRNRAVRSQSVEAAATSGRQRLRENGEVKERTIAIASRDSVQDVLGGLAFIVGYVGFVFPEWEEWQQMGAKDCSTVQTRSSPAATLAAA